MTDERTPATAAGRWLADQLHDDATAFFAMTSRRFSIQPLVRKVAKAILKIEAEASASNATVAALDVERLREAARIARLPWIVSVEDIENLAREYDRLAADAPAAPVAGEGEGL